MESDSERTVTETELFATNVSLSILVVKSFDCKTQEKYSFQQAIQAQEVVELISDSEVEISEPKKRDDIIWKLREPKRSNQYIPEEPEVKMMKANEGWLTKNYPSDRKNIPNAIDSFRKEMSSKDA